MYRKVLLIAVIFKIAFSVSAQEIPETERGTRQSPYLHDAAHGQQIPRDKDRNIRNYLINFRLRIVDHENNPLVDSVWSRVTRSGQSVSVNLRVNNLNIAVIFIPYFRDENSIMLLSQSKVILKYLNYPGGRYYSVVDSIPLKLGEKALFFPLGLLEEKIENISSCVLEIEVLLYDRTTERGREDTTSGPAPEQNMRNRGN